VPYPNGVVGKYIVFNMEERQRVKIVEYVRHEEAGGDQDRRELKEKGSQIRLDSFIDPALVRRVEGTIREMLAEKGYLGGEVTHAITSIPSGPEARQPHLHRSPRGPSTRSRAWSSSATRR